MTITTNESLLFDGAFSKLVIREKDLYRQVQYCWFIIYNS